MYDLVVVCEDMFGLDVLAITKFILDDCKRKGTEPEFRVKGVICPEQMRHPVDSVRHAYLGTLEDCRPSPEERYVLGIKYPDHKKMAADELRSRGAQFTSLWAPWVLGSKDELSFGEGCIIAAHSIKEDAVVGSFVTIFNSMVSDGCIGDYSTLMTYANVTNARIGREVLVENNALIMTDLSVGDGAVVGPGSMVIKDVKPGTSVFGVPAKKEKKV